MLQQYINNTKITLIVFNIGYTVFILQKKNYLRNFSHQNQKMQVKAFCISWLKKTIQFNYIINLLKGWWIGISHFEC